LITFSANFITIAHNLYLKKEIITLQNSTAGEHVVIVAKLNEEENVPT